MRVEWSSSNATSFYINSIGYVPPNASSSAIVGPMRGTRYEGTVSNGVHTAKCDLLLSVWIPPAPTCVVSVSPNPIFAGQSAKLTWKSVGATSCKAETFDTKNAVSGSVSVSPQSSTTYTVSCSGVGGRASCTGNGDGGRGASLVVNPECTPQSTYSCAGPVILRTDTSRLCEKSTTEVQTCVAPSFCTTGAAHCYFPALFGSISTPASLVASGAQVQISWSSTYASSCIVTGNGDMWTGRSGTEMSSPITEEVTYSLNCTSESGDLTRTVTITPLPAR